MICKNNLSFNICDNESFKAIFRRLGFYVKSSTYYRTTLLKEQSKSKLEEIYKSFSNKPFYIQLDETSNRKHESILNILIGSFNSIKYEKPKIIFSGIIENTKSDTIYSVVESVVSPLLKFNYNKNNFKIFLSDGAA